MATPEPGPIPVNDLRRGFESQRARLLDATRRVLESGYYVQGPEHQAFEAEFAAYLGGGTCVAVGNGTDALEIALRALGPPPGSVVATVANAAMYTTTAARRAGLRLRYVDVEPESLLIDVGHLADVLNEEVSVVVVTHLYGRMANVAAVTELCRPRGIRVLEDCAQAVGARADAGPAGTLGDAAAFSFYPTKNLGALGDGGAVVSRHEDVAARARQLRQYGWRAKYDVTLDGGGNSRLDELQAAVLRTRLPDLDSWNARRRSIVDSYARAATGTQVRVLPARGPGHVAHLAVAISPRRDAVQARLRAAGVATDVHYPVPDHRQPVQAAEFAATRLPITDLASTQVLSLPCFPELTDVEVERVCDVLATG